MIEVVSVSKDYPTRSGINHVLNDVSLTIGRSEKVGILGRNGSGKSTLIRLISGADQPTRGVVRRGMSVSWPLAFGGAFQGSLTGADNVRFICRVYGQEARSRIAFVDDFAELGRAMNEPVSTYSSGMQARLAFAISMAIEFDCFLIDEVIAVGDDRFHEKCRRELFEKRADRAIIMVSHNHHNISEFCQRASVLDRGTLHNFGNVDDAYQFYSAIDS
ncbi:MAG: ABC transporter ATP-binding protein [Ideonella sp.]|nr:ABC transporter ATP-binding protein [Ideonella sp.]